LLLVAVKAAVSFLCPTSDAQRSRSSLDDDYVVFLPLDHAAMLLDEPNDEVEILARNRRVVSVL
jgi:hypothetical protein